jgi:hypothetical protein
VHKYADWIARHRNAFFVSAYTSSSAKGNEALQDLLTDRDIPVATELPPRLVGNVAFLRTTGANHTDYVTRAWADDPIRDVLERMPGYARTPPTKRTDTRRDPCAERHPVQAYGATRRGPKARDPCTAPSPPPDRSNLPRHP